MQEQAASLEKELADSEAEKRRLQAEANAALQDAKEALHREAEIQQQLQAADQVLSSFVIFDFRSIASVGNNLCCSTAATGLARNLALTVRICQCKAYCDVHAGLSSDAGFWPRCLQSALP